MEPIKISLCPVCGACPEVAIEADGVRIGEADNMVRLSHAEWNQLVDLIRIGKLPATEVR
jgi:formylmethanofuran dehydrogenase subunit B